MLFRHLPGTRVRSPPKRVTPYCPSLPSLAGTRPRLAPAANSPTWRLLPFEQAALDPPQDRNLGVDASAVPPEYGQKSCDINMTSKRCVLVPKMSRESNSR